MSAVLQDCEYAMGAIMTPISPIDAAPCAGAPQADTRLRQADIFTVQADRQAAQSDTPKAQADTKSRQADTFAHKPTSFAPGLCNTRSMSRANTQLTGTNHG